MKINNKTFALVDCNNFYVSCERAWNPSLRTVPVVVLSNNDACAISRSQEAKNMGVKMGMPYFKMHEYLQQGLTTISSNYALYADMSRRTVEILRAINPEIEPYSIDESFLDLTYLPISNYLEYGSMLKNRLLRDLGLPVGVGIASTKTLAKIANKMAKTWQQFNGVCDLKSLSELEQDQLLRNFPVEDIWGIGGQSAEWLKTHGISTAYELKKADPKWIRKNLKVIGERIVLELNNISCIPIKLAPEKKKGISSTRQFGSYQTEYADLARAVTWHVELASEKLRSQNSLACVLCVFIKTNRHAQGQKYYSKGISIVLTKPDDYTPRLVKQALAGLKEIYASGYSYHKTGVYLTGIIDKSESQHLFLTENDHKKNLKEAQFMRSVDYLNDRWGNHSIFLAAQGTDTKWQMKKAFHTLRCTTHWKELITIDSTK